MIDWLVHDWQFLGFNSQVWMPLMALGLALYIAALIVARNCHSSER